MQKDTAMESWSREGVGEAGSLPGPRGGMGARDWEATSGNWKGELKSLEEGGGGWRAGQARAGGA